MNRQELEEKLGLPGEDALEILSLLKQIRLFRAEWDFCGEIYIYQYYRSICEWSFLFSFKAEILKPESLREYITINELVDQILDEILENGEAQVILKESLE